MSMHAVTCLVIFLNDFFANHLNKRVSFQPPLILEACLR